MFNPNSSLEANRVSRRMKTQKKWKHFHKQFVIDNFPEFQNSWNESQHFQLSTQQSFAHIHITSVCYNPHLVRPPLYPEFSPPQRSILCQLEALTKPQRHASSRMSSWHLRRTQLPTRSLHPLQRSRHHIPSRMLNHSEHFHRFTKINSVTRERTLLTSKFSLFQLWNICPSVNSLSMSTSQNHSDSGVLLQFELYSSCSRWSDSTKVYCLTFVWGNSRLRGARGRSRQGSVFEVNSLPQMNKLSSSRPVSSRSTRIPFLASKSPISSIHRNCSIEINTVRSVSSTTTAGGCDFRPAVCSTTETEWTLTGDPGPWDLRDWRHKANHQTLPWPHSSTAVHYNNNDILVVVVHSQPAIP